MLRPAATRPIVNLLACPSSSAGRSNRGFLGRSHVVRFNTLQCTRRLPPTLALAPFRPANTSVQRYASAGGLRYSSIDKGIDARDVQGKPVLNKTGVNDGEEEDDVDMLAGIRSDLKTIRDTFALSEVPREAYYIGLAGVLPYLATSMSTFYLAWDINFTHQTGHGFLMSGQTAELLLQLIQPLQVGYGAVIISFLGAIHWGLEFAGYGGYYKYKRYAVGVAAPAIAWPTMLMPYEYALITQFLTFTFLYFTDAKATKAGWFPTWYSTYRFVLTFVVGASLVITLIGHGKVADKVKKLPGPADNLKALKDQEWENLEREDEERRAKTAADK